MNISVWFVSIGFMNLTYCIISNALFQPALFLTNCKNEWTKSVFKSVKVSLFNMRYSINWTWGNSSKSVISFLSVLLLLLIFELNISRNLLKMLEYVHFCNLLLHLTSSCTTFSLIILFLEIFLKIPI